jgi:hypothetical protein
MLNFLLNVILTAAGLVLGGTVLLAGRRMPWVSLAIIALVATGNLLARLVAGLGSGLELAPHGEWLLLTIAVGVGALGWYLGKIRRDLAVTLIGLVAGLDIALWLRAIIHYFSTEAVGAAETAVFIQIPVILFGALLGWWFLHHYRDEGLILVTVIIGVETIFLALRLDGNRSSTAVILLSLALAGVVVQYADYLRSIKATEPLDTSEAGFGSSGIQGADIK